MGRVDLKLPVRSNPAYRQITLVFVRIFSFLDGSRFMHFSYLVDTLYTVFVDFTVVLVVFRYCYRELSVRLSVCSSVIP